MWQTKGKLRADVAELAYARVLKTLVPQGLAGSTPAVSTTATDLKSPFVVFHRWGSCVTGWYVTSPAAPSLFVPSDPPVEGNPPCGRVCGSVATDNIRFPNIRPKPTRRLL